MYSIDEIKMAKPLDEFEFVCKHCGKKFIKTKRYLSKTSYKLPVFCCPDCQKKWYEENSYVNVECKNCGKEMRISIGEYNQNENKNFFCSHSCSASYNNKNREKRSSITWVDGKKGYDTCPKCGNPKTYNSELCRDCRNKERVTTSGRTLGSFIDGHKYLSSRCTEIRRNAKKVIEESAREKVCEYCHNHEFDDILEIHHIKGILEFDSDSTVAEINDEKNLIWLCPNHHKMLEKGLISLPK